MEINWIENTRSSVTCTREVRVTTMTTNGRKYTTIAFYGNSQRKITDGSMVKVGINSERIYFDKTTSKGFKLSRGSTHMLYIRIPGWKEDFVGEHDLIFDAEKRLWYIPTKGVKKG